MEVLDGHLCRKQASPWCQKVTGYLRIFNNVTLITYNHKVGIGKALKIVEMLSGMLIILKYVRTVKDGRTQLILLVLLMRIAGQQLKEWFISCEGKDFIALKYLMVIYINLFIYFIIIFLIAGTL